MDSLKKASLTQKSRKIKNVAPHGGAEPFG
jgi:hypothetical protein